MTISAYKLVTGTAANLNTSVGATANLNVWQPFGPPLVGRDGYLVQAVIQGAPSEGVPPGSVPLSNGDSVSVKNSANTTVTGTHTAEVAAGTLTDVKLSATIAPVVNGLVMNGLAPTGTYASRVTFTVAGGVITAIALS